MQRRDILGDYERGNGGAVGCVHFCFATAGLENAALILEQEMWACRYLYNGEFVGGEIRVKGPGIFTDAWIVRLSVLF